MMMANMKLSQDAHSRVAVLFVVPSKIKDEKETPLTLVVVSVKWLIAHGVPIASATGQPMVYHGTYIIQ